MRTNGTVVVDVGEGEESVEAYRCRGAAAIDACCCRKHLQPIFTSVVFYIAHLHHLSLPHPPYTRCLTVSWCAASGSVPPHRPLTVDRDQVRQCGADDCWFLYFNSLQYGHLDIVLAALVCVSILRFCPCRFCPCRTAHSRTKAQDGYTHHSCNVQRRGTRMVDS